MPFTSWHQSTISQKKLKPIKDSTKLFAYAMCRNILQPTKQLHMCVVEKEEIATCTYHKPKTSSGQIVLLWYFHHIIPFFGMNQDNYFDLQNQ